MLASTPSSMDIIGTMGQQAEQSFRSELSNVSEEAPTPGTQNTDHWLVRDTTGELLIAMGALPKYQALIATVNEALAESSNAASLLQTTTRRMLVVRRAARALAAQLAEEQAIAAAKLQLAARLRAESKAEAARQAEQHVDSGHGSATAYYSGLLGLTIHSCGARRGPVDAQLNSTTVRLPTPTPIQHPGGGEPGRLGAGY